MFNRKLGMMGGALLVMLSMVVIGCKGVSSGDTDAWTENGNKKKVWEKTNSSTTDYLRAYEQFGSTTKPDTAEVKLTVGNAANAKAGLIFGLKKNPNDTISYFVVGVGTQVSNQKTPEYYISYYDGVTPDSISQTSSGEAAPQGSGKVTDIKTNTPLSNFSVATDGSLTVYVKFAPKSGDAKTIELKLGTAEDSYTVTETITLNTYQPGAAKLDGGIAAYAMLRPAGAAGSSVSTTNTYEVIQPAVIASAE